MLDRPSDRQNRYPGYDVLSKRMGPSWNEQTRRVVTRRLAIEREPRFFTAQEFETVNALAARIVPQPATRAPIPVAASIDHKLYSGASDGYRVGGMPREGEAWRLGLRAIDAEAASAYGESFRSLAEGLQVSLLERMQRGELHAPEWGELRPKDFFEKRMARDIVLAYYAYPAAWSEIGWGGPASPRGYVRLDFGDRDPWEAAEARDTEEASVLRINRHVR
ncbi:gluconate 2-dehydrogenase subunit 3 family protein [Bradyrhizobium genosp. P]|uniref:gluconate 2-dehydrogenase subunit 3 family protein n=1 Tax=Bradyrhizobium genosp. P TaxID=83641 RepID=UPI003CF6C5D9